MRQESEENRSCTLPRSGFGFGNPRSTRDAPSACWPATRWDILGGSPVLVLGLWIRRKFKTSRPKTQDPSPSALMFKFLHAADIHLDSPLKGLEQYDGAPVERDPQRHTAGLGKPGRAGHQRVGGLRAHRWRPLRRRLEGVPHRAVFRQPDGPPAGGGNPRLPDCRQSRRRQPHDPAAADARQCLPAGPREAADGRASRRATWRSTARASPGGP